MELLVQLGPARLTLMQVIPGRPGEAVRVHDALRKLDPDLIASELTLREALREEDALVKGEDPTPRRFIDRVLRRELHRFGRVEAHSPHQWAAKYARENRLLYLPLAPKHDEPGLLTRWRFERRLKAHAPLAESEEDLARAIIEQARQFPPIGKRLEAEERLLASKLEDVMEREQRTRVAAILTYPRGERVAAHLRARGYGPATRDGQAPWETR